MSNLYLLQLPLLHRYLHASVDRMDFIHWLHYFTIEFLTIKKTHGELIPLMVLCIYFESLGFLTFRVMCVDKVLGHICKLDKKRGC